MECDVCSEPAEVRHVNLYVNGSEGICICHACEMDLISYIRTIRSATGRAKLAIYKHCMVTRGKSNEKENEKKEENENV